MIFIYILMINNEYNDQEKKLKPGSLKLMTKLC